MSLAALGQQLLSVLLWFKSNYQIVVLILALILLPVTNYWTSQKFYTMGSHDQALKDLAVKPDTVVKWLAAVIPEAKTRQIIGSPIPLTVDYKAREDSAVAAAKDSIEGAYRRSLAPWSYDVRDTTDVTANGRKFRVPSMAHIEVNAIDHIAQVLMMLFPFEVPQEQISRGFPIEVPPTELELWAYRGEGALAVLVAYLVYLLVRSL